MDIKYHYKTCEKNQLQEYYNPVVVKGYCSRCDKYGKYWPCPPHSVDMQSFMNDYDQVMLIGMQIFIDEHEEAAFSDIFHSERRNLGLHMEQLAAKYEKSKIIIAGHCYHCDTCSRSAGLPCIKPDKMSYSLEALGYEVSKISENILNLKILWSNNGKLPEYMVCLGAILYK